MERIIEINGAYHKEFESYCDGTLRQAFIAGALWADKYPDDKWISVEKLLPEYTLELLKEGTITGKVLVKTKNNNVALSYRHYNYNSKHWEWKGSGTFVDSITHWQTIKL